MKIKHKHECMFCGKRDGLLVHMEFTNDLFYHPACREIYELENSARYDEEQRRLETEDFDAMELYYGLKDAA